MILSLVTLASMVSSCSYPYKVLASEMKIDLNGNTGFSIDKAKVKVSIRLGEEQVIPLTMKNYTNKDVKIVITQRIPDFVAGGYTRINEQGFIKILPIATKVTLPALGSYTQEVVVKREREEGQVIKTEAWISVIGNCNGSIARELILRILIGGS